MKTMLSVAFALLFSADLSLAQQEPEARQSPPEATRQLKSMHQMQEPDSGQAGRLPAQVEKLQNLVKALTRENDLLKKRLDECSKKMKAEGTPGTK